MARKNVKGNSYGGLGLTAQEEVKLKKHVEDEDTDLKKLLRKLIRENIFKKKSK